MDEQLINAYAYSNLQRAILTTLLYDILRKEEDPVKGLQGLYNIVKEHLQTAEFPPGNSNVEQIRQESLSLMKRFFLDVEGRLSKEGIISEKGLRL